MKHFRTKPFKKMYAQLPLEIQKTADKNFALLTQNPKHPSLHFKHIRESIWSARVGINYRALARQTADGFQWFWIGPHDPYTQML